MILPSWFWALTAVITAAANPILAVLNSGAPINLRSFLAMIISAIVGGFIGFKSYYSTKYGDEQAILTSKISPPNL